MWTDRTTSRPGEPPALFQPPADFQSGLQNSVAGRRSPTRQARATPMGRDAAALAWRVGLRRDARFVELMSVLNSPARRTNLHLTPYNFPSPHPLLLRRPRPWP